MKKKILLSAFLFASCALIASPVGKERASRVASNAVSLICAEQQGIPLTETVALTDVTAQVDIDLLHVFNYHVDDIEGFIVISGDDIASPVLAFSFEGGVGSADANPAFRDQLLAYSMQLQKGVDAKSPVPAYVSHKWQQLESGEALRYATKGEYLNDNINQLLGSMIWGQGDPYNKKCPGGSVTGCVATAFGMIMNYWDYPEHGFGMHAYNGADNPAAYPGWSYGVQYADFEHTYYDWEHMDNSANINSPVEVKNPISTLLYHIGVSLEMRYSPSASGCWSLPEYGMFDTSLHLYERAHLISADYRIPRHFGYKYSYSGMRDSIGNDSLWLVMLYNSLAEGKPIYYAGWASENNEAGHSGTSGHGYIIDGYFSDPIDTNFFHINWGWNGAANGFFKIDAMRPQGNDFTKWHGAIIGIEPDTSYHGYDYTGIRQLELDEAMVYGGNGHVAIHNALGRHIAIFDVMGRQVVGCTTHESEWRLALRPGFYAVKVGSAPAKKILVY